MINKKFFTEEMYDTLLYETEHFTVIPSLGSFIEGWVLIVPKEEILNFSQLTKEKHFELDQLINTIKSIQDSVYGNTVIFEHGPSAKCSKTGCGVDYAHLHLVPCEYNLIDGFQYYFTPNLKWHEIQNIAEIANFNVNKLDYLYYRTQDNKHFVAIREEFPSQIFRQIIAHYKGLPSKYDWKKFPEYQIIKKTIAEFKKIKVHHES
ncbi:MAG: HIT domain-containing protein [Bacteroidales bacterium]|nr:HIT domain-containing protein [Bacteroidales bacterium]